MNHLLFAAVAGSVANAAMNTKSDTMGAADASYDAFLLRHGHRQGVQDPVDYARRQKLYNSRLAAIEAHNSEKRSWRAAVNRFADYTHEELQAMLGYKRSARSSSYHSGVASPSSFLQLQSSGAQIATPRLRIASEVNWATKLRSAGFFRDQGSCGSCWAVAAAGAMEMQSELIHGNTTQLSYQQLVDCVPNPQHCGGTGGCNGATAELAFEYIKQSGLARDDAYSSGSCQSVSPIASLGGWKRLPVNKADPLLLAVAHGPVVVSVDGGKWFSYDRGIFDGCEKDVVVNHAVLAIGYGKEASRKYWLIRNSWGGSWGDEGKIRLLRHSMDQTYCGIDNDPKQGVGCDGGPEEIPVCGMCGVLSDSSHPVGTVMH